MRFNLGSEKAVQPSLYFLAPDDDRPSGGTMVLYRHVDILNAAGFAAMALHRHPGFSYSWFDHQTRTGTIETTQFAAGDVIVFPETEIDLVAQLPPRLRYVIFNQNCHLTWKRPQAVADAYRLDDPRFLGTITVSSHNRAVLARAFAGMRVERVRLGIDSARFTPSKPPAEKRIGYMPRRGSADAQMLLGMLNQRGLLRGWEVVALDGLRHDEVATQLQALTIFLSFSHQEGFGLPAAEAMACGCHVIGYHGFGGREFFARRFSTPIASGDVMAFAEAVAAAVAQENIEPGWCRKRGIDASRFIQSRYSRARETADVVAVYARLCGDAAHARPTAMLAAGAGR